MSVTAYTSTHTYHIECTKLSEGHPTTLIAARTVTPVEGDQTPLWSLLQPVQLFPHDANGRLEITAVAVWKRSVKTLVPEPLPVLPSPGKAEPAPQPLSGPQGPQGSPKPIPLTIGMDKLLRGLLEHGPLSLKNVTDNFDIVALDQCISKGLLDISERTGYSQINDLGRNALKAFHADLLPKGFHAAQGKGDPDDLGLLPKVPIPLTAGMANILSRLLPAYPHPHSLRQFALDPEYQPLLNELLAKSLIERSKLTGHYLITDLGRDALEAYHANGPDVSDGPVEDGFAPGFEERCGKEGDPAFRFLDELGPTGPEGPGPHPTGVPVRVVDINAPSKPLQSEATKRLLDELKGMQNGSPYGDTLTPGFEKPKETPTTPPKRRRGFFDHLMSWFEEDE